MPATRSPGTPSAGVAGVRLLAAAALLVVAGGCSLGGGSTPSASGSPTAPGGSPAPTELVAGSSSRLSSQLLQEADLPAGWTGSAADPGAATPVRSDPGCSSPAPTPTSDESAAAVFTHLADGLVDESISEVVDGYASAAQATAALAAQKAYLGSCASMVFDGVSLQVRAVPVAGTGADGTAVQLTGSVARTPIVADVAYARSGAVLVRLTHVAAPPISTTLTGSALTAALGRVTG